MIILFHCLYMATKNCISFINKPLQRIDLEIRCESKDLQVVDAEVNLSFDPPVYKQRYGEVQLLLLNNKWSENIKKVVDFGCAELKLFTFIKYLYRINHVLEVDVDEDVLRENVFRVRPLLADYISRRTEPLKIHILKGSISYPDERLVNTDAVVGIEIVEHLYPDVLDGLPYNVFGFIRPKIAVFTTPNADFNILFPNFQGFRHYDHKFEWTREQFESWALNITTRFPNYSVSFKGIGEGPKGTEHLGCCSQMSVFVKEIDLDENNYTNNLRCSYGICSYFSISDGFNVYTKNDSYELIEFVEYPYEIDKRTPREKICDELKYRINIMSNINGRFYNDDRLRFEIPINELIFNQNTHFTTNAEARSILKQAGFEIEECIICDQSELCVVYEPDMESRSSTPASNTSDTNISKSYYVEWAKTDPEPDWEVDKDDSWMVHTPNQEHEEALTYASDIVHNIINNLDLECTYENSSESETCNKQNLESTGIKCCLSNTDFLNPMQSVSTVDKNDCVNIDKDDSTSTKTFKKDTSHAGVSNVKKKKKGKKDVAQNGLTIHEEFNDDNPLQQAHVEVVPEPMDQIVENGDLANNNRDLEGNNYPNAVENIVDVRENDNEIVNLDLQDNANGEDDRNVDVENRNDIEQEIAIHNPVPVAQNDHDMEIEFSSTEALFDSNSQVDLLEEFDISADGEPNNSFVDVPILQNIVFVGVDLNDDDADPQIAAVLPINAEPFPNWLLNLLGAGVPEDAETHDEPHFYCQGDGLGVHPSFIEEEFDEESTTSDSSDSTTSHDDEAEADPSVSELDIGSLPDDVTETSVEQNSTAHIVATVPEEPQKPETSSNHTAASSLSRETADIFLDSIDCCNEILDDSSSQKQNTDKDS